MTFNWWNAEMPIELCKAALSNAPAMTWSQAALYTAHAMIWSQRSYQWIWYEIMNNLSRVKSCFLSRLWIEFRNCNLKICTWYDHKDPTSEYDMKSCYQPSIIARLGSSMPKEPGFLSSDDWVWYLYPVSYCFCC